MCHPWSMLFMIMKEKLSNEISTISVYNCSYYTILNKKMLTMVDSGTGKSIKSIDDSFYFSDFMTPLVILNKISHRHEVISVLFQN